MKKKSCKECGKKFVPRSGRVSHFCDRDCYTKNRNDKKNSGLCMRRGCTNHAVDVASYKRFCRKHRDERNEHIKVEVHYNDQLAQDLVKGLTPDWYFVEFREQAGRSIILEALSKIGLSFINEPLTKVFLNDKKVSVERRGDLLIPDLKIYIEAKRGVKTSCLSKTIRQFENDLNLIKDSYDKGLTGFYYSIIGDIGHSLSEALMILQIKIKDAVKNGSLKHKPWITAKLVDSAFDPIVRELLSREQALGIN